jgi:hypothetical protein
VLPAGLALFTGTQLLGNAADHVWVGGALTFAAGLLFGFVGHLGSRRFTTWAGGFAAGVGAISVALDVSGISDTSTENVKLAGPGLLVIAFGAGLVALAYAVSQMLDRGDGEPGAPPADSDPGPPIEPPVAPLEPSPWYQAPPA